jgi:hypothetical protein
MRLSERQSEIAFGVFLLVSVLGVALVGEGLMRVFALRDTGVVFNWGDLRKATLYTDDANDMDRFIPGSAFPPVRINAQGFRGPELAPADADTIRIGFLGDSTLLAAELEEDETPAGLAMLRLSERFPQCRLDYVLAAGPSWGMDSMAVLAEEDLPPLAPDLHVVMAGRVPELLRNYMLFGEDPIPVTTEPPALARHSRLWFALWRLYHWQREDRRAGRIDWETRLPQPEIRRILGHASADLRAALEGETVLAIVDTGLLGPDLSPEEAGALTRVERTLTQSVSALDYVSFKPKIRDALTAVFREEGWRVIDPLAGATERQRFYMDDHHFNIEGAALYADAMVEALDPMIRATGRACLDG